MFKSKSCFCVLLFVLIFSMLVQSINAVAGVDNVAKIDYYECFDDTDIDGLDIVWADKFDEYGITPVYDDENMFAIKTWVSDTRPVRITHPLGKEVKDGMFYVSFDYQTIEKYNDCYLRFLSGDKQFQICGFRNNGKFGHFLDFSRWALDDETAVDYTYDTWYTVGILFDMDSRNSYFYFGEKGGELKQTETVALNDNFTDITDIVLVHSFGDYSPALWDNIRIYDVTLDTIEQIEDTENLVFDKAIYQKYVNQIYIEDFETETLPDLNINGWSNETDAHGIARENDGGNYAVKTWVDSKYPKRLTHSFEKSLNDGLYYISFDWKSLEKNNSCYLRLLSGDKQFQICGFRPDGNFGKFVGFTNWALNHDTEVAYSPNQWYTVGVLLDFDLRNAYIYFGEKDGTITLLEKTTISDDFLNITDMVLVHSFGEYTPALWDNIKAYKLSAETSKIIGEQEKVVFDKSVTEGITCILSTEKTGNIFHNADTVDMNVKYYNRSIVYKNIDVRYETLYNNECMYSEEKKVTVETESASEDTITLPVEDKYGFFEFVVLTNDGTETKNKTRFSNARTADDGVRNPKLGTTIHMTRVKDKEATFEILKNGGFSSVRGGQNDWNDVETEKGVFKKTDENSSFYDNAVNEEFEVMTILKGSNSLYADEFPSQNPEREGKVENPPQSDGLIEKFSEYCYQTVVMYPNVKYFQIWNEWNNAPTFNNDGITDASYYAKLLKAAYAGVKRGAEKRGKEALVVAMAPSGTKPYWIRDVLIALDGNKFFDVISVHPYTYSDGGANKESTYAPEDICVRHTKESGNVVTRLQMVYSILESYGYSEVPVWAGEFGFSSYICGEEKQAQYAVRMMALCDGNELLDKMLWYTFQNHAAVNENEQNYGMIRYDENVLVPYEAKPVYLAMSNYNALMANAKFRDVLSDGEDEIYAYEFVARDGDKTYTVWTTKGEKTYTLDVGSKLVKAFDIYGNETTLVSENGSVTFNINESMTYIKVSDVYAGLIQSGKVITEFKDITDEDIYITARANGYENCSVLVAWYKDGIMLDAKIYNVGNEDINLGRINSEADKVCVFMWKDMMPICDKLIIE